MYRNPPQPMMFVTCDMPGCKVQTGLLNCIHSAEEWLSLNGWLTAYPAECNVVCNDVMHICPKCQEERQPICT